MIATRNRNQRRRGAATVEMAVVTPLLLTIVFGIIEYGWVFSVQQSLVTAAREGARTASLPGTTVSEVQARVSDYLSPLGIQTADVDVDIDGDGNPTGLVELAVPYADVSLLGGYFGSTDFDLTARASMRKEGDNGE